MKKTTTFVLFVLISATVFGATSQKDEDLNKQLRGAIILNKFDEVKNLIKAGVDVNRKFNFGASRGITPLYLAVLMGQADIAKALIEAGADVNLNYDGMNLLHVAGVYGGNKAVTELLIAKGLDVNAKCTAYGEVKDATPLHAAAGKGNVEVAEVLIENGAELDAKVEQNHYTTLHVAVRNNQKAMAELLIAKGADVNAKTKYEETPLDLAISKGYEELADLLRKHGGISGKK